MNDFRRYLSDRDLEKIESIWEVFREVEAASDAFRTLTGVRCPDRCGECCTRSKVEASTLEMMPLAMDLWEKGEAEFWLEKIAGSAESTACVFYKAEPENPLRGRCGIYEMRPLVCRLFGFFMARNKHGQLVYTGCRVIKQKDPEMHRKAVELLSMEQHLSAYTDFAIRTVGLDSGAATMPVNKAASAALLKVGYRLELFRVAG